jgi:hypothetical protein
MKPGQPNLVTVDYHFDNESYCMIILILSYHIVYHILLEKSMLTTADIFPKSLKDMLCYYKTAKIIFKNRYCTVLVYLRIFILKNISLAYCYPFLYFHF